MDRYSGSSFLHERDWFNVVGEVVVAESMTASEMLNWWAPLSIIFYDPNVKMQYAVKSI